MLSPKSNEQSKNKYAVDSKEFGTILKDIIKKNNQIFTLSDAVAKLNKNETGIFFPNMGKLLTRADVRNLRSQLNKEIRELKKYFTEAKKKKKRVRSKGKSKGTKGFSIPIKVTQNMQEFFRNANLGYVDPRNSNSALLNNSLSVSTIGITTRAILTPLLNIYIILNNLQSRGQDDSKQYLTSDALMDQYFERTYQLILQDEQQKAMKQNSQYRTDKNGKRIPFFDPKKFRFASLQSIVKFNTVPKENLDQQEQQILNDPNTLETLKNEQRVVSCNLYYYRNERKIRSSRLSEVEQGNKMTQVSINYDSCRQGNNEADIKLKSNK